MKQRLFCFLLAITLMIGIFPIFPKVEVNASNRSDTFFPEGDYKEGTVLVTLASPEHTSLTKKGTVSFDKKIKIKEIYDLGRAEIIAKNHSQQKFLSDKNLYISEVSSSTYSTEELTELLDRKAYVVSVEPDYTQHLTSITDDPLSDEQWYLDRNSHFQGASTGISYLSTTSKEKSDAPVIAIMDTGINTSHEDLTEHLWKNPYRDKGLPGVYGYNFSDNNEDCTDVFGHGTHCAGIIASTSNNQKGISGISNAKLMTLKIFDDSGETQNSDVVKALDYILKAKQEGCNIVAVNCSWGGGSSSLAMATLIQKIGSSGTLFTFAAGNDSVNHDVTSPTCPYDLYQGSFGISENRNYLIIIGASDPDDNPCQFSDYGQKDVDLFAPGDRILSSYYKDTYFPGIGSFEQMPDQTQFFYSFDDTEQTKAFCTDMDLGLSNTLSAHASFSNQVDYYENPDSGSLRVKSDTSYLGAKYFSVYLDVTAAGLNPNATYYISFLLGLPQSDNEILWQHTVNVSSGSYGGSNNRFYITKNGQTMIRIAKIALLQKPSTDDIYYFDQIGISVANPDSKRFGQYELSTGTSMAAPMVTGALALFFECYPEDTLKNRRQRLLSCVRKSDSLSGKCITGGILDLTQMDQYVPSLEEPAPTSPPLLSPSSTETPIVTQTPPLPSVPSFTPQISSDTKKPQKTEPVKIKKLRFSKKNDSMKAGKKRKLKINITPSNAKNRRLRWRSSKKKWATVTNNGTVTTKKKGIGHTVTITALALDGSRKKAVCRIRIKK